MIDLNKLAEEIHAAAVEKGFWDVEEAEEKHLAKMISELGEVVQADRAGVMYEIERDGAKPEGVVAELADFVMMLLDLQKHWGYEFPEEDIESWNEAKYKEELPNESAYNLATLLAMNLMDSLHLDDDPIIVMVYLPYKWCKGRGYDIWEIIRQKMEYNRSRPKLHGRLY
jgi:hypothetical protein